ncbi:hypothetical protein D5086_022803 [Populus alba]|uniref:Uncharacterized protein n=1 Tax=Populus alba TaxID=43335 RepID=A0ACC4B9I2_POPAL
MMDRSTTTMRYQAWKRDPKIVLLNIRSSTVFEDASPEVVKDFFWDDDFRTKEYHAHLSQGEISLDGLTYTTQAGVSEQILTTPDHWAIALSRKELEIVKLGVRQGMWGTVKKIEPGLHAYQKARALGAELSRPAFIAQINTKINPELLRSLGGDENLSENEAATTTSEKSLGQNIPKLLIFCGAIILACSFDRGLLTKAFIFNMGRRFGNMGRNARLNAGTT